MKPCGESSLDPTVRWSEALVLVLIERPLFSSWAIHGLSDLEDVDHALLHPVLHDDATFQAILSVSPRSDRCMAFRGVTLSQSRGSMRSHRAVRYVLPVGLQR